MPSEARRALRAAAGAHPEREAVVEDARRLTYAELDAAADAVAEGLRQRGVRRGDRVAVVLPNGADLIVAAYGALRAGAAFTLVHPGLKAERIEQMLADAGRAVLVSPAGTTVSELTRPGGVARSRAGDLAANVYTSGSTGARREPPSSIAASPRGAVAGYLGLTGEDRILCALPLSHTYGLSQLLVVVRSAATLVLEYGVAFPGRIVATLERERITVLSGVPTLWQVLLGLQGLSSRACAWSRSRRGAAPGAPRGGPSPVPAGAAVRDVRPDRVQPRLLAAAGGARRAGRLVGVPLPGTDVWLDDGTERRVTAGGIGELVLRAARHAGPPERPGGDGAQGATGAAAHRARPAHRRPGPRRRRRLPELPGARRRLRQVRRRKGGAGRGRGGAAALTGWREASVVGVDDQLLGQAVVAHVSARPGHVLDPRALRGHWAHTLETHAVPRDVLVHRDLPKNVNGKLDRLALAEAVPPAGFEPAISALKGRRPDR